MKRLRNFGLAETVELQMRVRDWAEARFAPGDDDTIMVSEVACADVGCPPLHTIIALMWPDRPTSTFKLFKALAEVTETDIRGLGRPGWTMADAGRGW